MPRSVALIGCGGFIGSHLTRRLLQEGWAVEGWDLDAHRIQDLLAHPHFTFHKSDYISEPALQQLENHCTVIHAAALCNPSLYNTEDLRVIESNYHHPACLAKRLAARGAWLIYFSTSEVYGRTVTAAAREQGIQINPENADDLLREDSSPLIMGAVGMRRWSYACAKQLTERTLVALQKSGNLSWTVVRPFNFLGPAMDYLPGRDGEGTPRVLACFMNALLRGEPLTLVDGGTSRRCFTWIGDAVEAVLAILENPAATQNECFNIGNAENEIDIAAFAQALHEAYLKIRGLSPVPLCSKTVGGFEFYGEGYQDSDRRLPDTSKAERLLGWKARTPLREILPQTVRWFTEYYG